ncbi:ZIP-like iron-zinc transporter [Panus rudis PR-1116 ss-1]|nr:ZIP-like iron-zinc transporter [Panus rudis PR-1116 ss-1]
MRLVRRADDDEVNCGSGGGSDELFGLRVASIFIILIGSMFGALFPVLARRSKWLSARIPHGLFDFAKYFGSGVIIATAFIHLLDPALDALGSPCLTGGWTDYPWALAIALVSIFMIFIVEIIAFRWGTATLAKIGLSHDAHGHGIGGHAAHGPEGNEGAITYLPEEKEKTSDDIESAHQHKLAVQSAMDALATQLIGIAILEFGVVLHSILIGLTLAVDEDFKVLFVVIVFHQTFEGLGVGSRLAYMDLPHKYNYVPICGALLYGITTPIGIAAGLGVRTTYNPESTTASIVSGILDSFSAGILIYTGLVELLAHEFLFNKEMINGSNAKLAYAIGCMMLGCGLMALLGRWA